MQFSNEFTISRVKDMSPLTVYIFLVCNFLEIVALIITAIQWCYLWIA